MNDPVEVFREKVKVMVAYSLEQINHAIDTYCDVVLASRAAPVKPAVEAEPPAKDKEEAPKAAPFDYANLFARKTAPLVTAASPQSPVSSSSGDFQYEDETPAMAPPLEFSESSGEPSDEDDDAQFIDDSPLSDDLEDDDDDDEPAPVRVKAKSKKSVRERRKPHRFSPATIKRARQEDRDAEDDGINLVRSDSGGVTKMDSETWTTLRRKPLDEVRRTPWYNHRWGAQLSAFRSALGRESANNKLPREIWDAIAVTPSAFDTHERAEKSLERCAFCGGTRACDTYFAYKSHWHYMGSCCAKLFVAWREFQLALKRRHTLSLEQMDRLFAAVHEAHAQKSAGGRK